MTIGELQHLKPEEKRVRIALLDGWEQTHIAKEKRGERWLVYRKGTKVGSLKTDSLPHYLTDLNAIHEAIMAQPEKTRKAMRAYLYAITDQMSAHFASAAQMSDAFLLTLS